VRRTLVLVCALALAGCGGSGRGHGTATHGFAQLWVTTDRGAHVVFSGPVPAGSDGIRTVEAELKVTTRYGGRYLQSVNGLSGSLAQQRDWFYFVNGIEAERGAAEYRLHPGDVEWWDFRDWSGARERVPVVVGAFPEPFLHGYDGNVRPAVVIGRGAGARAIARLLHARVAAAAPRSANVFRLERGAPHLTAQVRAGGGVEFDFSGDALALARRPGSVRFRYQVTP
jgi:hypothetical protein